MKLRGLPGIRPPHPSAGPRRVPRALSLAVPVLGLTLVGPGHVMAQTGRIWGTSTMQFVELRPLVVDSLPESQVPGDGLLRPLPGGGVVRCIEGEAVCRYSRSGDEAYTVPTIHDISATAWGFLEGVRVYARAIVRAEVAGGDQLWPRSDDAFDLVLAYGEWSRRRVRIRGGRQWKASGLGFYNYDGLSAELRLWDGLRTEFYGGWSLARGLNEPRTGSALSAIESFVPDHRSLIFGVSASYRPSARGSVTAIYQRELLTNRKGLVSERVAVDGLYRRGRFTFEGTFEADLPSEVVNEATGRIRAVFGTGISARIWARRYEPFFELWTIWGAFTPVAFTEFGGGGGWQNSDGALSLGLTGSWRRYGETGASSTFVDPRTSSWRISANGSARVARAWSLQGRYGVDLGFGASSTAAAVRTQWDLDPDAYLGASLEAFQTDYEFRVQDGTVFGLGLDGGVKVGEHLDLTGGLGAWWHRSEASAVAPDWSQLRAHLRLRWSLGPEAGLRMPGGVS
jgi:hypothetical protein